MVSRRELLAAASATVSAPAQPPAELHWLSIAEAGAMLRRRAISPVELVQHLLRRIEALNPRLNAFITVQAESALAEARAAEKELAVGRRRGPLHGIPVALKDLYDTAGVRTTAASAQYENRVPVQDAAAVARLKSAGAILLGKLNMDEFAYNFTSETSYFGAGRNPWDTQRSPGGSSSGSAIAVAAGMCFAALGSDTGGSIRLPAALCGVTGLKPSYGRVDVRGVTPLAWSLDHAGPLCRSAADAAAMLAVLDGQPPAALPAPVKRLRLGIPRGAWLDGAEKAVRTAFETASKQLGAMCQGVREVELPAMLPSPLLADLPAVYLTIIQAEAYTFHEEMARQHSDRYHAATLRSIRNGATISAADYIRARQEMERLRIAVGNVFREVDLLLTPASFATAPFLGPPAPLTYLRNTAPFNLLGLPAISTPCGFSEQGLPIGLQITGAHAADGMVLGLADAYQRATDWHTRRPPGL